MRNLIFLFIILSRIRGLLSFPNAHHQRWCSQAHDFNWFDILKLRQFLFDLVFLIILITGLHLVFHCKRLRCWVASFFAHLVNWSLDCLFRVELHPEYKGQEQHFFPFDFTKLFTMGLIAFLFNSKHVSNLQNLVCLRIGFLISLIAKKCKHHYYSSFPFIPFLYQSTP